MKQYIDKSAIIAEIERLREEEYPCDTFEESTGYYNALDEVSSFLDTLEVKEVEEEAVSEDLEEAARDILDTYKPIFSSSTSDGEPIEYYSPGQMRTIFMKGSYWQKEHCLKGLMTSDLETSADKYAIKIYNMFIKDETTLNNKEGDEILSDAFKAGAEWRQSNLWKSADGDDLPELEREVVVFTQNFPDDAGIMKVGIAHRPDPKGWDGRNILTGKAEHFVPKTYGKGGWSLPDVKIWLDCKLPFKENEV